GSVVQRLANLTPHRKARDGAAMAPPGLVQVLASAFTPHREARPSPNCAGASEPHPPDDHGEPTYMSTQMSSPLPLSLSSPPSSSFCRSSSPLFPLLRRRRSLPSAPTAVLSRPARADGCQGWPLFSGHPLRGLRPLQQSSTTAGLIGRVDYTPVCYLSLSVSERYSDHGCGFWQVLLRSPWPVR